MDIFNFDMYWFIVVVCSLIYTIDCVICGVIVLSGLCDYEKIYITKWIRLAILTWPITSSCYFMWIISKFVLIGVYKLFNKDSI